jgi:hypothetical protein
MMAIGFITFALIMAGVSIEAAKNRQAAEAEGAPGRAGELLR